MSFESNILGLSLKGSNDFVKSVNSMKLFVALDIPQTFLSHHPSTWEQNDIFLQARCRIQTLQVIKDAAECGVALIQSFNGS